MTDATRELVAAADEIIGLWPDRSVRLRAAVEAVKRDAGDERLLCDVLYGDKGEAN